MPDPEAAPATDCQNPPCHPPAMRIPSVQSEALLAGNREVRIIHGQEVYRLMLTRNNKLILQK